MAAKKLLESALKSQLLMTLDGALNSHGSLAALSKMNELSSRISGSVYVLAAVGAKRTHLTTTMDGTKRAVKRSAVERAAQLISYLLAESLWLLWLDRAPRGQLIQYGAFNIVWPVGQVQIGGQ